MKTTLAALYGASIGLLIVSFAGQTYDDPLTGIICTIGAIITIVAAAVIEF